MGQPCWNHMTCTILLTLLFFYCRKTENCTLVYVKCFPLHDCIYATKYFNKRVAYFWFKPLMIVLWTVFNLCGTQNIPLEVKNFMKNRSKWKENRRKVICMLWNLGLLWEKNYKEAKEEKRKKRQWYIVISTNAYKVTHIWSRVTWLSIISLGSRGSFSTLESEKFKKVQERRREIRWEELSLLWQLMNCLLLMSGLGLSLENLHLLGLSCCVSIAIHSPCCETHTH